MTRPILAIALTAFLCGLAASDPGPRSEGNAAACDGFRLEAGDRGHRPTAAAGMRDASPSGSGARSGSHAAGQDEDPKETYKRRRKEAGDDVDKLWELYLWCDAYGLSREGRSVLRAILKVEPNHRQAHEALGHLEYDGRWFKTEKELAKYKAEKEEREAKEKGLVRFGDEWVPAADVPYLEKGMVRDDDGNWVTREEYEKLKAGWKRQDLVWIPPDEVENIEKGLWKCGDRWLPLEDADRYHSAIERWWVIPSPEITLYTTCPRSVAERALSIAGDVWRDLARICGTGPAGPVDVVLLASAEQYGRFAAGNTPRGPVESSGLSSVHYAFFADAWYDFEQGRFHGAGVAYWDSSTEAGDRYGPHAFRHAAAQSYLEAIDPSPKAVQAVIESRGRSFDPEAFWEEKRFPEWFRYGAAAYVERYFVDSTVAAGGDPYWPRTWSVQNILNKGGLRPLRQIFEDRLSVNDAVGSAKLINERGLIVAFVLDGGCKEVIDAHSELKMAIQKGEKGKSLARLFANLEKAIQKHEADLRRFAKL